MVRSIAREHLAAHPACTCLFCLRSYNYIHDSPQPRIFSSLGLYTWLVAACCRSHHFEFDSTTTPHLIHLTHVVISSQVLPIPLFTNAPKFRTVPSNKVWCRLFDRDLLSGSNCLSCQCICQPPKSLLNWKYLPLSKRVLFPPSHVQVPWISFSESFHIDSWIFQLFVSLALFWVFKLRDFLKFRISKCFSPLMLFFWISKWSSRI